VSTEYAHETLLHRSMTRKTASARILHEPKRLRAAH
jgi:hypothetical protein